MKSQINKEDIAIINPIIKNSFKKEFTITTENCNSVLDFDKTCGSHLQIKNNKEN